MFQPRAYHCGLEKVTVPKMARSKGTFLLVIQDDACSCLTLLALVVVRMW